MCVKVKNGNRPSTRADHRWTSEASSGTLLGKLSTSLRFKCGKDYHNIKLKGVNVPKLNQADTVTYARLMRQKDDKFMFFVDLSVYGVSKISRKRGGYYLYVIERDGGEWVIKRHYYSRRRTRGLGLEDLEFFNVFWKVFNSCYYGVATEETSGGDNSS